VYCLRPRYFPSISHFFPFAAPVLMRTAAGHLELKGEGDGAGLGVIGEWVD